MSLSSNSPVNLQRKPSTVTIEDDDGNDFVALPFASSILFVPNTYLTYHTEVFQTQFKQCYSNN